MTKCIPLSFAFLLFACHPYSALVVVLAVQEQNQRQLFPPFLPLGPVVLDMSRLTVDKSKLESKYRPDIVMRYRLRKRDLHIRRFLLEFDYVLFFRLVLAV